jgi:hypothetical protein
MTITAVVTQYFGRYCASSNSPVFAHIWVWIIPSLSTFNANSIRFWSLRVLQSRLPCTV